jgi:acetyl-CoA carboxylase biotin carboxyl carrier protein
MPYQHIDQITAALAGTGITLLELTGPEGHIRLGNGATSAVEDIIVTSPGTGLFRHGHPQSPGKPLSTGAEVAEGAIIGLLQVGALLLPVVSPCAGQVTGHLVPDGELVGYGTRLLTLAPRTTP